MYHRFYGYTVAPDPDGNRWTAVKDGAITLYAPTEQEMHDTIRAVTADDYRKECNGMIGFTVGTTVGEIANLATGCKIRIDAYNSYNGDVRSLDIAGDVPFDVAQREATGISVLDDQLIIEYSYYDEQ